MTSIRRSSRGAHVLFVLLLMAMFSYAVKGSGKPNVIVILCDDCGWGDFQGVDPDMVTPNVEKLRGEGLFLNQSYVMPSCVPTRSALLTGRYPHTYGMQHGAIQYNERFWLNETLTLLPQEFQKMKYTTHMLGKWHLGFCHPRLTPPGRGFSTFYGFWAGAHTSYFNHSYDQKVPPQVYDWFNQDKVDWTAKGKYQTDLLSERAVDIIKQYNNSSNNKFFMYMAYGAAHGPWEAPEHYQNTYCSHITNTSRKIHCAMMAVMDHGVGQIVKALKDQGIYDDTTILFLSDNGGPVRWGSVNYPLRGSKKGLFEGSTRSYTVLKDRRLKVTNATWPGMAHVIDWYSTLVTLAGGKTPTHTHGKNLWPALKGYQKSPRTKFIYNVNDYYKLNHLAIRNKEWKLIRARPGLSNDTIWMPDYYSGWYPRYQDLEAGKPWDHLKLKLKPSDKMLFNLEEDPEERKNLYNEREKTAQKMEKLLEKFLKKYPMQPTKIDPRTTINYKDDALTTCWCHPTGLANTGGCPLAD